MQTDEYKRAKNYVNKLKSENPDLNPYQIWQKVNEDAEFLASIGRGAISETFVRETLLPEVRARKLVLERARKRRLRGLSSQKPDPVETKPQPVEEPQAMFGIPMNDIFERYDSPVTVEDFAKAIKNSINRAELKEEDARLMAEHVLNFFGFHDRMIDNMLETDDRDSFYILEDAGLLKSDREETTTYDGREWRINYWLLKKARIMELSGKKAPHTSVTVKAEPSIYDEILAEAWVRKPAAKVEQQTESGPAQQQTRTAALEARIQVQKPEIKTNAKLDISKLRAKFEQQQNEMQKRQAQTEPLETLRSNEQPIARSPPELISIDDLTCKIKDILVSGEKGTYDIYDEMVKHVESAKGGVTINERVALDSAVSARLNEMCRERLLNRRYSSLHRAYVYSVNTLQAASDEEHVPKQPEPIAEVAKQVAPLRDPNVSPSYKINAPPEQDWSKGPEWEIQIGQKDTSSENLEKRLGAGKLPADLPDKVYDAVKELSHAAGFPLSEVTILNIIGRHLKAPTWQIREVLSKLSSEGRLICENNKYRPAE
jgi:hypothetical protein